MRTTPWTPSSPSGYGSEQSDKLGINQRVVLTVQGGKPDELAAVAALYLAIAYMRAGRTFSVSTLEGVEVANNRGEKLKGDESFLNAMYLMEQSLHMERHQAINDTMDSIARGAGIDLDAVVALRNGAAG